MNYYFKASNSKLNDYNWVIETKDYFENELKKAKEELKVKNKSMKLVSSELPGIVEYRYAQLQELEAIIDLLEKRMDKLHSEKYKHYSESYNKILSDRQIEKYVNGEDEILALHEIIILFSLLRNQYHGIMKSLEILNWQISNITKLVVAALDNTVL